MIQSLKIQNFQSHERSILKFSKGVNVIIGNSDSGKSAIIRALRWVIWNRPSGSSFRSHWGGKTLIELQTENHTILRSKDKQDRYVIKSNKGEDIILKAFGTKVPEEIYRILNINEVNLQTQLGTHFLLSKSPGEVAQYFNKVAGLDKIDKATSYINSEIRNIKSEIKIKTGQVKGYQEEMKEFVHLEKLEAEIEVLEEMEKRQKSLRSSWKKLSALYEQYQDVQNQIKEIRPLLDLEEPLNKAFALIKEKEALKKEITKLTTSYENYIRIQEKIAEANSILKLDPLLTKVLEIYKEKESYEKQFFQLKKAFNNFINIRQRLKDAKARQALLQSRFEKEMGNVCLLCGQIIKHG